MTTTEQVEATEPAAPALDLAKVKASYDAGNFSQAFKYAQILSVEGNPDAQLYLGKIYADGRGTLQVRTSAHMWFNIASMNGSDEAFDLSCRIAFGLIWINRPRFPLAVMSSAISPQIFPERMPVRRPKRRAL